MPGGWKVIRCLTAKRSGAMERRPTDGFLLYLCHPLTVVYPLRCTSLSSTTVLYLPLAPEGQRYSCIRRFAVLFLYVQPLMALVFITTKYQTDRGSVPLMVVKRTYTSEALPKIPLSIPTNPLQVPTNGYKVFAIVWRVVM